MEIGERFLCSGDELDQIGKGGDWQAIVIITMYQVYP